MLVFVITIICNQYFCYENSLSAAKSLIFTGDNYAQYALRQWQQFGTTHSSYEEKVSLQFRTEETEGILFYVGAEESGDFAAVQVCIYTIIMTHITAVLNTSPLQELHIELIFLYIFIMNGHIFFHQECNLIFHYC